MSEFFDRFQGGIYVMIKENSQHSYYFGENSWWLIDDWESDIINSKYFKAIEQLKIEYTELKSAYRQDCVNSNISMNFNLLPSLYIDFDNKVLYNNFYDQALEDRLIEGWKGVFIEKKDIFLTLIPKEYNYWDEGNI